MLSLRVGKHVRVSTGPHTLITQVASTRISRKTNVSQQDFKKEKRDNVNMSVEEEVARKRISARSSTR